MHISNLPHGTIGCPACALNILTDSTNETINSVSALEVIAYTLIAVGLLLFISFMLYVFIKNLKNNKNRYVK